MKTVAVILVLVAAALAKPVQERGHFRTYDPEEENPDRFKTITYRDETGNLIIEDLTQVEPRRKATKDDIVLHLHNRDTTSGFSLKLDDLDSLVASGLFDPKKKTYFIAHGWKNDAKSAFNVVLKNAILKVSDSNVFVVDWGKIAHKLYVTASGAVPAIGDMLGDFINQLIEHYNITPKQIRLAGHSLGAHISGCAGARVKEVHGLVDYIVGMDPASPNFSVGNTDNRLDASDAEFVQVIHTSTTLLGFRSSIGHSDYFPNGGNGQPGCAWDISGACSHGRSYYYFEESILKGGFTSKACESYKAFKKGKCKENHTSHFGSLEIDREASGDYYLKTNRRQPYSIE